MLSGVFRLAQWYISPASVALQSSRRETAQLDKKQIRCRLPDSLSQRGWLLTWQDLRKRENTDPHRDLMRLMEIYLSSMSNSGAVDRMLGRVKMAKLRRGHVARGGLEAALRLITCDEQGRRVDKLNPLELLTDPVPKTTASGLYVAQPCTKFALHCQRLYSKWFGERRQAGRGIEPASGEELLKARLAGTKPKVGRKRKQSDNSEKAKLQKHSESLLAAVARVTAGGGGEAPGPLGPVSLPENASKGAKAIIAQQAAACRELEVARRRGSTPASSSSQPVSVPWLSTQERARVSKFTEWFGFSPHFQQ